MLLGKRLTRPLLPASHATPPSKRVPIHELPSVRLPSNQDEAVTEAASCISMRGLKNVQVKTAAKVKSKGFSSPSSSPSPAAPVASSTRKDQAGSITIGVELPIEPSPAALASLASQIAKKLDLAPSKAVLIAADPMVLNEYKKGKGQQCLGLQEACRQDQLSGVLLLIGLKVEDVALVDQLVSEVATGSTCIFVNCDFRGGECEVFEALPTSLPTMISHPASNPHLSPSRVSGCSGSHRCGMELLASRILAGHVRFKGGGGAEIRGDRK